MVTRRTLIAFVVVGTVVAYSLYSDLFHIYTLRDDNGGTMVWNSSEAYLFMSVARRGYRMNWAAYGWGVLGQWLNAPPTPTDQRIFFIVMRVTSSGVEHYAVKVTEDTAEVPHFFTPIGQTIYAFSEGAIYRWSGNHFDKATQEEQQRIGGMEHLSSDSDTSINGWSKCGIGQVAGDTQFSIEIGERTLKIRQGNVYKSLTDSATVELYHTGQTVQELWRVNAKPRIVSEREYKRNLSAITYN